MTKNDSSGSSLRSADDFIKEIGGPTKWDTGSRSTPESASAASAPAEPDPHRAGHVPPPDELDWQQAAGRGVAKEGASLLTGAAHLANRGLGLVAPETSRKLGDLAERVPGVRQMEEFAAEPYQSFAEGVGGTALDVFGAGATPELGLGRGISALANKIAPTMRYVRGARGGARLVPTTFGKITGKAATAAETAGKGAIGGAVANPDDPVTGAEIGAAAGAAIPGVGGAMRSPVGQFFGGSLARSLPSAALGAGIGYRHGGVEGGIEGALTGAAIHGVHHSIRSYHSPVGHWLHSFGKKAFDKAGRFIGYIHPLTGGIIAGRALDGSMPSFSSEPSEAPAPEPEQ